MLVWGISSMRLKAQYLLDQDCHVCQHERLVLHGIQAYRHFWFIPMWPHKKHFMLTCPQCEGSMVYENPEKLIPDFKKHFSFKAPKLSYLGLLILVGFFAYSMIFN